MAKKNNKNVKVTKKSVKPMKHVKYTGKKKSVTQRFGMDPRDLGKCAIQNIKLLDRNDARFELHQLSHMTGIGFDKEIKALKNPNIAGQPKNLNKVIKSITKKYPQWKKSKDGSQILG